MAKKSWIVKANKEPKFEVRRVSRCKLCGRSRAYMGKFATARICFGELASQGKLPGVSESS